MHKILKYVLIAVAVGGGAVVALVAYLAATFDPNAYKPQIQQAAKEKLDRTLKIGGDIKLTFYPTLGANLGGISLSERASDKEFASVESVRVALQLMPLLSRQAVVNQVEVRGLRANLIKRRNGTMNIDDLLGKDKKPGTPAPAANAEAQKPAQFDIDHVLVDDAGFSYTDEGTGAKYTIGKLGLKTGKIAAGTPSDVAVVVQGIAATQPRANLDARLKTRLSVDTGSQRFRLEGLEVSLKGEAAGMNPLALELKGTIEGDAKAVKSDGITLELDAKQGDRAIKARLATPLAVDVAAQKIELSKLVASLGLTDAKAAGKPVNLSLTGAARADLPKHTASLDFSTKFDDSSINGKAGVTHFDPPAYVFDVNVDKLDLDRYTGKRPADAKDADPSKGAPSKPEQPLDLSALKSLNARGRVKVDALKASNLHAQNVRMDLKAASGRVDVNPLTANLYQGTLSGSFALVAAATPQIMAKQALAGISIGPLLKDLMGKDMLEGKGNVNVDIAGQGTTVTAIRQALHGSASLDLANGALKGINIGAEIRKANEKLASIRGKPQAQTQALAANTSEKTDFTELKASFAIRNGVAHNSDLSMKSPLLRLGGEGDIDIGADSMNYLAKATLVATAAGQGGKDVSALKGLTVPVRISGPFAALKYEIDVNAMVSGVAQQKIDAKKEEVKAKVQDKIKDQLRGLFKR